MVNADTPYGIQHYAGAYINDTFRANNKLTLTLGLRWEYTGYWSERHDWNTVWLPGAINPALKAAGLNYAGDMVLVNSERYPNRLSQSPHWRLFSPRLGAAWRPNDKTVIRSGRAFSIHPARPFRTGILTPAPSTIRLLHGCQRWTAASRRWRRSTTRSPPA